MDYDLNLSVEYYAKSVNLDPLNSVYWHNYGIALHCQCFYGLACMAYKLSLQLNPSYNDAWCNLGISYLSLNHYSFSKSCFKLAVSLDTLQGSLSPCSAELALDTFLVERAFFCLENNIALDISTLNSLWNFSLVLLLEGDYFHGWKYYESRFSANDFKVRALPTHHPCPLDLFVLKSKLQGEIIVWSEQGIGDSIQFCRYLYLLHALDIPFKLQTDLSLVRLFNEWMGFDAFASEAVNSTSELDNRMNISLLSLPRLFRTELNTIPSFTPYLRASKPVPTHLHVNPPPGGLAVGVIWATNSNNKKMYQQKSISLSLLMPILLDLVDLDLIEVHCLQVGDDSKQLLPWADHERIFDWSSLLTDFSDTAHVVNQLDLVISVDTAVAHLAAALSIPVWLLLPYSADFRWLKGRADSPWYPTMRLFRQANPSDWESVLVQLKHSIDHLLGMDVMSLSKNIM